MILWCKDSTIVMKKRHGDVTMIDVWPAKHMLTYFGPFGGFQADFSLFWTFQAKPKMTQKCPESVTNIFTTSRYPSLIGMCEEPLQNATLASQLNTWAKCALRDRSF